MKDIMYQISALHKSMRKIPSLLFLSGALGGDKALSAAQMSKAQLTIKNKAGAGQLDTKKFLPTPNHSLQLWNLLLVNVGISHLQMVPGSQVMKLVCYGFQTGMAAALTKRNSNVLCQSL